MAATQTRAARTRVTRRIAQYAAIPAAGTQPSSTTSAASQGFPNSTVASTAITPR